MESPVGQKRPLEDAGVDDGEHVAVQPAAKRPNTGERTEAVLRIIVPSRKVGSIIGKAGAIVKQIRDETGTRIRVVEAMPHCEDRVIVISGVEDLSQDFHGSQDALQRVHMKTVEGEEGTIATPAGLPPNHLARLLVCHTQAGCVIGKAGKIIKDIRETSGAFIKVLPPEELPPCALANDRVIHMTGSVEALQTALRLVSKQIRENPPKERPEPLPAPSALAALANQGPGGGPQGPGPGPMQGGGRGQGPPFRPSGGSGRGQVMFG